MAQQHPYDPCRLADVDFHKGFVFRTPVTHLLGTDEPVPLQSYGAFRSTSPTVFSERISLLSPELSPLSPELPLPSTFSEPPPPYPEFPSQTLLIDSPPKRRVSRGCVYFWLAVVLLQVTFIVYRSNTLAKFVDSESTARHASNERFTLLAEREKSEREREKMRHDRELWKMPEDHVPPGTDWKPILPAWDCRGYGKREYWGELLNKPKDWSAMDACMNTPARIEGVTLSRPHRCAFVSGSPNIHGYWMVDWNQNDCKPWHKGIRDTVSPRASSDPCWDSTLKYSHLTGMYELRVRSQSNRGEGRRDNP